MSQKQASIFKVGMTYFVGDYNRVLTECRGCLLSESKGCRHDECRLAFGPFKEGPLDLEDRASCKMFGA